MKSNLKEKLKELTFALYPKRCICCGSLVKAEDDFCEECISVPEESYIISDAHCSSCGSSAKDCICKKKSMFYNDILAPYYYRSVIVGLVQQYKFRNRREISHFMAQKMLEKIENIYPAGFFDLVCFVPQTEKEMKDRGYNQAELIAENVARELNIPKVALLEKIYETQRQHSLSAAERSGNIFGVFEVCNKSEAENKKILLIDDLKTTGATLNECAKMLLINNAFSVTAAVFALTDKQESGVKS